MEIKESRELTKTVYGIPFEQLQDLFLVDFNDVDPNLILKTPIKVDNRYIECRTEKELSIQEVRILMLVMFVLQTQDLQKEDGCFGVKINKKAIEKIVTDTHHQVLKTLSKLINKVYLFERTEFSDRYISLFIGAEFYHKEDYIVLFINPFLNKLILNIRENYTKIKLQSAYKLRRYYSAKLYMMLRRFIDTGYRIDNLEDLKEKLGCRDKYNRFIDFERRVLQPSVNEINNKTDILVSYNKITEGKRITGIEFKIEPKDKQYEEWIENKFKSCCMKYIETNMSSIKNPAGFFSSIYGSDEKLYNFIKDAIELFKQKYEVQLRFDEGLQLLVKQSEIIFKHSPKLAFLYLFERSDRDMIAKIIRSKNIFL